MFGPMPVPFETGFDFDVQAKARTLQNMLRY
jgi:hypothetical protein